ncbi:MAG TPA: BamA/TamA family outer membrane protein [Kofleriaceae bacterium]|nr:BamA/TamA family outer membrane protein [Kofleriaceae bacterium]
MRSFLLLTLGVALVTACGARPRMVAAGEVGVGDIRLSGASSMDDGAIIEGLGLTHARETGQPFARFLVGLDRRRVRSFYVRRGFFGAEVESEVTQRGALADVTFTIAEGPRASLARVVINGAPGDIPAGELRDQIPIDDGDTFDYERYEQALPVLVKKLQEHGYARAKVNGMVIADAERHEAVIQLDVAPGPVAHFGKVAVDGVPDGLEGAVAARIEVQAGARYSMKAIDRTRAALYELGRFGLVRIESDHDADEVVDVMVRVEEAPRHEVRLGGGVGSDPLAYEVRGRAAYGVAAWPWALTTARTELRPAVVYQRDDGDIAPRLDATATLDRIDLFAPRFGGTAEASFSYLAVEAYTSYGPRLRLVARSPMYARIVQASVGWQLGLVKYTDVSELIDSATETRLRLDRSERIGAFEASAVVDLRDDRIAPTRGAYLEVRAEQATKAAGGALTFLRLAPEARGYLPLGPVVLGARARAGVLDGDVPATRRFFAGGANSHRGFPERHLAPFVEGVLGGETLAVPYGGAASLEVSTELRFPLPDLPYLPPLAGAAFLDGGDVTETWGVMELDRLHWASGLGLRVPTPIGAVRLDVGYRLNRFGAGEPLHGHRWAYHLSVGEAF